MTSKLEIIGIDHGWSMMKGTNDVFVTGVKEITTTPAMYADTLEYQSRYYRVGTTRQGVFLNSVKEYTIVISPLRSRRLHFVMQVL